MATAKSTKTTKKRSTKASTKKSKSKKTTSLKGTKNPKGGLTAKGRAFYKKTEGAHLKPGVQGKADTPEKMKRKGSFLRRHFANLRGPLKDKNGEPTRLALQAHAWGEKVPTTEAEAKKLADKGTKLLAQYHQATEGQAARRTKTQTKSKTKASAKTKSVRSSKTTKASTATQKTKKKTARSAAKTTRARTKAPARKKAQTGKRKSA